MQRLFRLLATWFALSAAFLLQACSHQIPAASTSGSVVAEADEEPQTASWQGMEFRRLQAVRTHLGSPESERGRAPDEGEVVVELQDDYWIAATEVTQGLWRSLMGNNPAQFQACGDDCPIETVSWYDAAAFMNRMSEAEGMSACYDLSACTGTPGLENFACKEAPLVEGCDGFRLPLQAEWEHAARAGTRTATYVGDLSLPQINYSPELEAISWYAGNSSVDYPGGFDCSQWPHRAQEASTCGPRPVAEKQPNSWGLHDMLGNVYEWTQDELPTQHLGGEGSGENPRIIRGGSWASPADACRASHYNLDGPRVRTSALGIRPARTAR